jgi:hypothetical protein
MPRLALALAAAGLVACGTQLNPSIRTPEPGELARVPGAFVAYNLGCARGCEQIRRGDVITAVDGRPITSGAEIDEVDLARGTPLRLHVYKRELGRTIAVDLLAEPNEYLRPLAHVPPLWTVGAGALDRAPSWARLKAYGHAIPALRLWRLDEPRTRITGRDLFGRGALIVYWLPDTYVQQTLRRDNALAPQVYARLQARDAELQAAGVDSLWVFDGRVSARGRDFVRHLAADQAPPQFVPMYANITSSGDPNSLGLQHQAADLNELVFRDGRLGPIVLVVDPRGIVRWHSRGFHRDDPQLTLDTAIDFAVHQLADLPEEAPPAVAVRPRVLADL